MLVVIEGIDGSGKGTVAGKLVTQLTDACYKVISLSFPRYEETLNGKLVGRYLNGDFGDSTHPYLHGTLYSLDRFESKGYLEGALLTHDVVVCDRYIPSNLCYSSMKAPKEDRDEIVKHFVDLEYGCFEMPVPDVIFFLDVPVKFALQNIAKKAARTYTDKPADLHEADEEYLSKVRGFYKSRLMKNHPPTCFESIPCTRNGHLLPIDKIVEHVQTMTISMMKGER
jgi:dTMP kinase